MSRLRVNAFSVSLDGYGAGLDQSLDHPLGVGGLALHDWVLPTRTFQQMVMHNEEGETGIDDDFSARAFANLGAWILGRNMFSPSRGPWLDDGWQGWWGDNPPYHVPVFVLTHYPRAPLEMEGGTTFYFVTDGIHAALEQAKEAASGRDIRIGGGTATIRQYLQAGLIDEMHLAITPVLLGAGEPLFQGIDLASLGYQVSEHATSPHAMHVVISKRGA